MQKGMASTKQLTASGELGAAGKPIIVYTLSVLSGGTAGTSTLKTNGASGTTLFTYKCGTVSADNIWSFGEHGMRFEKGCYWTKDGNSTDAKFVYATVV